MIKRIFWTLLILALITGVLWYLTRLPVDSRVILKKHLIDARIKEKGYKTAYFIISQKRHRWYNNLLQNSIGRSNHLKGLAMDLWVMDLNGDGKWDRQDIDLMAETIKELDIEHPELSGWIGTYLDKGRLASRMVHFDVGGKRNPKWR